MKTTNIIIAGAAVLGFSIFAINALNTKEEQGISINYKNGSEAKVVKEVESVRQADSKVMDSKIDSEKTKILKEKELEKISDLTKYVLAIPKPTEKDIKDLNKDFRYGEGESFRDFSKETILAVLPNISREKLEKIIPISADFTFKSDVLYYRYINGDIDFDTYIRAERELSKIIGEKIESVLSPEEFKKMGWVVQDIPENTLELKVWSKFPNVGQNVKNLEELYGYIDPATVENLLILKEDLERNLQLDNRRFLNKEISYEELDENGLSSIKECEESTKNLLTEEQYKILFLNNKKVK